MVDLHSSCRAGLGAIDAALAGKAEGLAEATRCAEHLREFLMEQTRAGNVLAETLVPKANSLVAELDAAELPLSATARGRLQAAREWFSSLAGDAARVAGEANPRSPS